MFWYIFQAIQALGLVIYQALDYGLDHSEERHLGLDLEALIEYMTNPDDIDDESQNIDDEGIEKDSEEDGQLHDRCTFQDIFMVSFKLAVFILLGAMRSVIP